jgi:hypothetical protein
VNIRSVFAEREGNQRMERVYKTMQRAGISNIILGIIILLTGITTGILMIINGSRLMYQKKNITF